MTNVINFPGQESEQTVPIGVAAFYVIWDSAKHYKHKNFVASLAYQLIEAQHLPFGLSEKQLEYLHSITEKYGFNIEETTSAMKDSSAVKVSEFERECPRWREMIASGEAVVQSYRKKEEVAKLTPEDRIKNLELEVLGLRHQVRKLLSERNKRREI